MKMRLIHRPTLTNLLKLLWAFWSLANRLKNEEHLLSKTPLELISQLLSGLSVVKMAGWRIVGHVTLWPLCDGWYELGTLWVDPEVRKHGVGEELMAELLARRQDLNVLMTTTNPIVKSMGVKLGMRQVLFTELGDKVHSATCVCGPDKTDGNTYLSCPHKDKKCSAFVNSR